MAKRFRRRTGPAGADAGEMMPFGAVVVLQVLLTIHAARTGRVQPWLYIIIFLPGIGCLLYVLVELGPELMRGHTGRRVTAGVVRPSIPGGTTAPWPVRSRSRRRSTTACALPRSACA